MRFRTLIGDSIWDYRAAAVVTLSHPRVDLASIEPFGHQVRPASGLISGTTSESPGLAIIDIMTDVTHILSQIERGDPSAADQLLPLVYEELRKLAAAKLTHEKPELTLQATALVHEAYLRLVDVEKVQNWDSRGHFFASAAEAMRRILVESARRRESLKRGGDLERVDLPDLVAFTDDQHLDLLALDEALSAFEVEHPEKAQLVKLRYFAGCSLEEAAKHLGISRATAQRNWAYARAWLYGKLNPA
jgi:RNA polymerase sigma factor (TIGR02999 family)